MDTDRTQPHDPSSHRYLVILRCRAFGRWPENAVVDGATVSVQLEGLPPGEKATMSLHVVTYLSRDVPHRGASEGTESKMGPPIWDGELPGRHRLGDRVIIPPDEDMLVTIRFMHAEGGDVDLWVIIESSSKMTDDQLLGLASPALEGLLAYINIVHGEFLDPKAPIQVSELRSGGGRQFSVGNPGHVHARPHLEQSDVSEILDDYTRRRMALTKEVRVSTDVACRRFLSALRERDSIDRFCDLWEACEFLSRGTRSKGTIVSRIATTLAKHTGSSKKKLEVRLNLKGIYDVRNDLVHNALENPRQVSQYTKLLEEVVPELIRSRLGLPYVGNAVIEGRLSEQRD